MNGLFALQRLIDKQRFISTPDARVQIPISAPLFKRARLLEIMNGLFAFLGVVKATVYFHT